MLHIILGILKIIGIVLGILLLLLLAVVLSVILVPVRYQVQARKQEDEVCAGIKVSWLLHIVSASFKINKRAEHEIVIRLFGIRLPLFGTKKKKKSAKKRAAPVKVKEPEDVADTLEDTLEDTLSDTLEDTMEPEDVLTDENTSEKDSGSQRNEYVPEEADTPERATDTDDTEKVSGSGKIRFSFRGICDRIKAVYGKLRTLISRLLSVLKKAGELPLKIGNLFEKAGELSEKTGEFAKKPGQLLELAERLEFDEVLRDVLGYLTYLLRHYVPRRIRGFLRFGTGDPAVTGQLTGLIYLILPARADRFTVQPEFGDAVLETEISCKGHIRAVHLIRVLWWGFFNKKLRRIIRYRNRG